LRDRRSGGGTAGCGMLCGNLGVRSLTLLSVWWMGRDEDVLIVVMGEESFGGHGCLSNHLHHKLWDP